MKRLLILFFATTTIISCNYKSIDEPGLKGRVKQFTKYKLSFKKDETLKDTVLITTTKFNKKGKVVEYLQHFTFAEPNTDYKGTIIYDDNNRIIKEIGIIDKKEIIVDYVYQDTLLTRTFSKIKNDDPYEMNEEYFYDDENKLSKRTYSQILFDENNIDTISSTYGVYKYNSKEQLLKSTIITKGKFENLKKTSNKYEYNEFGLQSKILEFNENDSLINVNVYEYKFDNKGSWIEKENYKNDTLVYLTKRMIEYD